MTLSSIIFPTHLFAKDNLTAEDYRLKGYEAQKRRYWEEALKFYSKAVALNPKDPVIFNDMGIIYEHMGLMDEAKESYLKALSVNKRYLPAYMNLAYLYLNQGDSANAIEYLRQRILLGEPNDPWTLKAQQELNTLDPGRRQREIEEETGRLSEEVSLRKFQEAEEEMATSIARSRQHFQKGQKLAKAKKYNEAISEYDQALKLTPDNSKILKAREAAQFELTKLTISQRSEQAMKMLELGDAPAAKDAFSKILTIIPDEAVQTPKRDIPK